MRAFLGRWLVTVIAVLCAAYVVPGVDFHGNYVALAVAALLLGVINAFLRPLLLLLTLPLVIFSLGIAVLFLNGLLFWLVGKLVPDFTVDGFGAAFWGALIVSLISFSVNALSCRQGRIVVIHRRRPPPDRDVIDV